MKRDLIAMAAPGINGRASIIAIHKPVPVETGAAEIVFEALDERVLSWLTGLHKMQRHACTLRAPEQRLASRFQRAASQKGIEWIGACPAREATE